MVKINKTPLDPKDTTRYTYIVDKERKKAQLMGYLESGDVIKFISYSNIFSNLINLSYADTTNNIDYQNRFVYVSGDKI